MQLDKSTMGVKRGAVPNEHFNEHTGFDFVVVAFSLLQWAVLKSKSRRGQVRIV